MPIWGLKQLYQSQLSSPTIYVLLVTGVAALMALLEVIFSGVSDNSAIYGLIREGGVDLLVLGTTLGAFTGLYLATTIAIARVVERKIHPKFVMLDADFNSPLSGLAPTWLGSLAWIAIATALGISLFHYQLRVTTGLNTANPAEILAAGEVVFLHVYLLDPVNWISQGLMLGALHRCQKYLVQAAKNISIDILNAEAYSDITIFTGLFSAILSVLFATLGALWILLGSSDLQPALESFTLTISLFGLLLIVASFYPVLVLRNRIALEIHREKEILISAVRGDVNALGSSRLAERGASSAELATWLILANTLSEWPVDSQIKKIMLFIVLPPTAWVLAAILENTLY
jgi:hypothetical protein